MTIAQTLKELENNVLDIVLNSGTLTTKYFKIELLKYKSLKTDFDTEDFIYTWVTFFDMQKDNINRIYTNMSTNYNALENYDKQSEISKLSEGNGSGTVNFTNDSEGYITNEKTTYNSDTLHLSEKQSNKGSDTTTNSSSNSEMSENITERTHGNIGVTTSQQMLKSEYEIRQIYIYKILVEMFVNSFCY